MKKRLLSLCLCTLLLCCLAPAVLADDSHEGHSTTLLELLTDAGAPTDFCGRFYCVDCATEYTAPISPADVGMPVMNIAGSLSGISKENRVTVEISYSSETVNFTSSATLNIQGNWTIRYPKKNLTVRFINADGSKNKVSFSEDWGRHSKYCLKANWIDASHARNIVSAHIYNEIVHSREKGDELSALWNGGEVDGFPVLVYLNGDYYGLFTLNIPKDNRLFGMKDGLQKRALLFGKSWSGAIALYSEIRDVNAVEKDGWVLEYCSTEDDLDIGTAWVGESMNEFVRFLQENEGESFRAGIDKYTDVERAIDVFLYTAFIDGLDNRAKNILWATFDGVKWIPSMYDMDSTWGLTFDGNFVLPTENLEEHVGNLLFYRLITEYPDEVAARYEELRKTALSAANILSEYAAFDATIPEIVRRADLKAWPDIPGAERDYYRDILSFVRERSRYLDACFSASQDEK